MSPTKPLFPEFPPGFLFFGFAITGPTLLPGFPIVAGVGLYLLAFITSLR